MSTFALNPAADSANLEVLMAERIPALNKAAVLVDAMRECYLHLHNT